MFKFNTDKKRQVVEELHKNARINFKRRKTIIRSLDDLFQADLVEMIPYSQYNNNYKYILVVINCFSKYAWAEPLKDKSGKNVSAAMEKIIKEQTPKNLQTDQGKEFFNVEFQNLMKKYSINHYSTYSEKKAAIVERLNRTLKNIMWKEFSFQGNYKWIKMLKDVVKKYNNTRHSTIRMKPIDVNKENEKALLKTVYSNIKISHKFNKFTEGDRVRISKIRGVFDKTYTPNWSTEIFTVDKVKLTNPTTYILKDISNNEIKGGFYEYQLQKVKNPDIYLVEKILKRRKNSVYVKWLGFSNEHNSWISKNNIA